MKSQSEGNTVEPQWKGLYQAGGSAVFGMIAIMIVQILVFSVWPPPTTVEGFFDLFARNGFLGLLSMDLLYLVNNALLVPIYLALYAAMRRSAESAMLVGLVLGLVGIAAYFASNTCFEMWALSGQFAAAASEGEKIALLGAGQALLQIYRGTAFDSYYVLNAAALLIFAVIALRSLRFGKVTAYWGLAAGVLMLIPSTVGMVGLIFSLASLVPWAVFAVRIGLVMLRWGRSA